MKYLIIAGILFCLNNNSEAQTTGSGSNGPTNSSEGTRTKKKAKKQKKEALNHRKTYKWKTGQRATPTGQEATGLGSGYSATKRDTSGKRED